MSKLHELLAVEGNLENQAEKCRADLLNTFEKKRHLFEEKQVEFKSNVEDLKDQIESQSAINTTVEKELKWISDYFVKSLDASYQVAETNTHARANVVLDEDSGKTFLENIPATSLLELEKRLASIQQLLQGIPTLDPAKGFTPASGRENVFVARENTKTRTRKMNKPLVLYPANDKHPAQTQLVTEDVPVGQIVEREWSGMATLDRKGQLLDRIEVLMRAVRKARSRANEAEVPKDKKIGRRIMDYLLHGTV